MKNRSINYTQNVRSSFAVGLPIILPLALSVITHLLNPIGFPSVHTDEGHNMNRALHLLQGLGPHEGENIYTRIFDHPYFGQVLVAAALGVVDYPDFVTNLG
jgi:hypothetical protein